jgi:hypothetical protein
MITSREAGPSGRRSDCLGYAEFIEALKDERFRKWFCPLEEDLTAMASEPSLRRHTRLVRIQRELVTLLDLQDRRRQRYPDVDTRGSLASSGDPSHLANDLAGWRFARFVMRGDEGDPVAGFNAWANTYGLQIHGDLPSQRISKRVGRLGVKLEVLGIFAESLPGWRTVEFRALLRPQELWRRLGLSTTPVPVDTTTLRFRTARREATDVINDLLHRYGRPLLVRP